MSLLDELAEPEGTGWRPQPGDVVMGTVVRISEGTSTYDDKGTYPIVSLRTEEGEVVNVHAFHAVLKSELAKHRPARGDRLAIKCEGVPAGKTYTKYRVAIEKVEPISPDWDGMATQANEELVGFGADEEPF